ncbi:MAG TPA: response regulator, partial [Patescibacteria group bacterium]|nr:response regulator [Patescibacteria group bacterium]
MYKVLIVDDEVLVRVGLKTTIDWEANGFTVVAEASNGEQGYEQYKKHMPDVIITDIKMPKRDGLWLVEEVRKENRNAKILVLTCYDEFSFARKALKLGADDYILKSEVEDEELIAVIQSLKKKLDTYNKAKHIQDKDLMNRNDIKRAIFTDMIKADFHIDANLLERCSSIEFPAANCSFAFACISIDDSIKEMNSEPNPLKQTNDAVLNILLDLFAERSVEYIYTQQAKRYTFFLSSQALGGKEFERMFASVINAVKQYFNCSMNI